MDAGRIAAGEGRHGLDALPVGDRHELALGVAILAQRLHTQGLLDQGRDADVVVLLLVLVGAFPRHATAPDARDGRTPFAGRAHALGPHSCTTVSLTGSSMRVSFSSSPCL